MPRILVVDDEPGIRALLRRILEREGHEVAEATEGADALRQIERDGFDVVITDMHMPDLDGLQLTRALRNVRNAPAIIAMSGNDVAMTFRMAGILGAQTTLAKPFTAAEVLAVVEAARARGAGTGSQDK